METRDGAGRYVRYLVGLTSRAVKPDQTTKCGGGEGGIYSLVARDEVIGFVTRALTDRGMLPNIASLAPPPTGLTNGQ
jgi:hypothetical protein